jgi:uncharacterized protein (TIGR00299 family) protein
VILWLNPSTGISGDMLLGALLGLGAPIDEVRAAIASTGVTGWSLEQQTVDAGGLRATRAVVTVADGPAARPGTELLDAVRRAVPAPAADIAATAVSALLEVESGIHGVAREAVHLHELGGVDTIVDTVGVAAAVVALGITKIVCAPVAVGTGSVVTAHGTLPAPAPATLALLRGASVVGTDIPGETVTPTGAALLLALRARYDAPPPMQIKSHAYGAGTRQLPARPNVLTAVLGTPLGALHHMVLLETNVDDVTGELLAHVVAAALDAGAADAWLTPITMKKGRPAQTVSVLTEAAAAMRLEALLMRETGSLGVRRQAVTRAAADRRESTLDYRGHAVRVKSGPWGSKAEWDDLTRVAAATGEPVRLIAAAVNALIAEQA